MWHTTVMSIFIIHSSLEKKTCHDKAMWHSLRKIPQSRPVWQCRWNMFLQISKLLSCIAQWLLGMEVNCRNLWRPRHLWGMQSNILLWLHRSHEWHTRTGLAMKALNEISMMEKQRSALTPSLVNECSDECQASKLRKWLYKLI
jgi:hypothetical protein